MSEKEKRIAEGIAKLPDPLKDRFLDKIEGAAMAMDLLGNKKGVRDESGETGLPRHDSGS